MSTETKTFTWNPTVYSYVVSQSQIERKAGRKTGLKKMQYRLVERSSGTCYQTRIEATPEGFAWIATKVKYLLDNPTFSGTTVAN